MLEFEGRSRIDTTLSIAPLIDVVFLLLIFFMLTSTMVTEQSLKLALPGSHTATPTEDELLMVEVDADKRLFLQGEEYTIEALPQALKDALAQEADRDVLIRADAAVPVELFVQLMDTVKEAGGKNISLATVERR